MPNTPETPGAKMVFIKPNIPNCWSAQPIIGEAGGGTGTEEISALSDEIDKLKASKLDNVKVRFLGVHDYKDTEAGVVLNNLKALGYYVQHTRSGTSTTDNKIRSYYNDTLMMEHTLPLSNDSPYSSVELFVRNGMWVAQGTEPVSEMTIDGPMVAMFSRALTEDEPYITDLILSTNGAASGSYRIWVYESVV